MRTAKGTNVRMPINVQLFINHPRGRSFRTPSWSLMDLVLNHLGASAGGGLIFHCHGVVIGKAQGGVVAHACHSTHGTRKLFVKLYGFQQMSSSCELSTKDTYHSTGATARAQGGGEDL